MFLFWLWLISLNNMTLRIYCGIQFMYICDSEIRSKSDKEISDQKRQIKEVSDWYWNKLIYFIRLQEFVLKKEEYIKLVEPFGEFRFEAIEAKREKRIPKYNYLYRATPKWTNSFQMVDACGKGRRTGPKHFSNWINTGI